MTEPWDYIVVGAGTAGCVVASRLSEDGQRSVLMLEAGGRSLNPLLHVPSGLLWLSTRYSWQYTARASAGGDTIELPGGRVVGGTSTINGMLWTRGEPADFTEWARLGCEGWEWDSVLPYFRMSETFEGGVNNFRGGEGPMNVALSRVDHPLVDAFIRSAANRGHFLNPDYNAERHDGVGLVQLAQRRGLRQSAAAAYLRRGVRGHNPRVKTGCTVQRVLFREGRAIGVEYVRNGRRCKEFCTGEVILSGGAIASPRLLMLSGIGDAAALRKFGIAVISDRPGVGQNLASHPLATMLFGVDVPTLNADLKPGRMARDLVDFLLRGRGPVTTGPAHAMLIGLGDDGRSEFASSFGVYGMQLSQNPTKRHRAELIDGNVVSARPMVLHPRARGEVALSSDDPSARPEIVMPEISDEGDIGALVHACRTVREVMNAAPISERVQLEIAPGPEVQTDEQWIRWIKTHASSGVHVCGTCRMGPKDSRESVVDPHLRVIGVDGLRVIDASIMPTPPAGGLYATTIMIGEHGADLVHGPASRSRLVSQ